MSTELLLDVLWLVLAVPAVLLLIRARSRVLTSMETYRRIPSRNGLSGSQVARVLLDSVGLKHVPIEEIDGDLTDHYDARHRALRLTSHNLHQSTIAAVAIAVHEVGHAVQHHSDYRQLRLRRVVVPAAVLLPPLGLGLIVVGALLPAHELSWAGTALLLGAVLLVVAVLPGEHDASRRGLALLRANRLAPEEDAPSIEAALAVSPLTYLALLFAAFGQLLFVGLSATGVTRRTS
jgi:Zn-dependent membrane protease YugP